jgi:glycerol-1-phosphate dehydrogenase [NAD(P)+]
VPGTIAFCYSDPEIANVLTRMLDGLSATKPLVVFGRTSQALLGPALTSSLGPRVLYETVEVQNEDLAEASRLGEAIAGDAIDAVVGIGGGRTLDISKYAAYQQGVPFIALPTQASHDGICSPVAVLRGSSPDRADSHGTRPPSGLAVPIHVISRAPRRSIVSGMADLAANLLAVGDWEWADQDDFDDYAALLARSAAELVISRRSLYTPDTEFDQEDVEILVHGLVLSGLAMTLAGSSRPASGSEHLISHAMDELAIGHGSHGEQVAVGSALAATLFGTPASDRVIEFLARIGAPLSPVEIGISEADALEALRRAPAARPDRRTRLSAALATDADLVVDTARRTWHNFR